MSVTRTYHIHVINKWIKNNRFAIIMGKVFEHPLIPLKFVELLHPHHNFLVFKKNKWALSRGTIVYKDRKSWVSL